MKFDPMTCSAPRISCFALILMAAAAAPCIAQQQQQAAAGVSVAALSLPDGSDGLLHWRADASATQPLQLSTRYFSDPVTPAGAAIRFYGEPVVAGPDVADGPSPLVTVAIPAGVRRAYIVLWAEADEAQEIAWRGQVLAANDWKAGSMKVFNVTTETLGIMAGEKPFQLPAGRSMDFTAADWRDAFAVRIVRLGPESRTIFSSTWRVTDGRREVCFIGNINGAITLRSLIELTAEP